MVHSRTVHLSLGALLSPRTVRVSSQVHALSGIFSTFLCAWKHTAAEPDAAAAAAAAVDRLDKMQVVRQTVQRQLGAIYD